MCPILSLHLHHSQPITSGRDIGESQVPGALIIVFRIRSERSGERFSGSLKEGRHGIPWKRKPLPHDWVGGTGRSRRATARAYCSMTSRGET
jgi:hypothetical protein